MEQDDIIEVYQEQAEGAAEEGEKTECIKLKVVGEDYDEIHFLVKMSTNMGKLKKSYAEKVGVPVSSLKFLFDGRRINDDESPEGGLISEDIFYFGPIAKKKRQISAQGRDLALFVGNGTKVENFLRLSHL